MEERIDWRKRIVSTPGIVGGKPRVIDTRLSVEFLLGLFAAGWTEAQVLDEYEHLTAEDLRAVFAYAAHMLEEESFVPLASGS